MSGGPVTIDGFNGTGDTIDLTGLHFASGDTSASIVDAKGTLHVTDGTNTDTLTLTGVSQSQQFMAVDDGTPSHGTLIEEAPGGPEMSNFRFFSTIRSNFHSR